MFFIVDTYNCCNKWDNTHAQYTFEVNGVQFAIYQVELDEDGFPILQMRVDEDRKGEWYQVYGSMEEAMGFVFAVKGLNAR